MKRVISHFVAPLVSVAIFIVAIIALRATLHDVHASQVRDALLGIPPSRLAGALVLTLIVYAILSFYDYLAFHHFEFDLPLSKIAFTSFIGNTLGLTLGFALLTGGSLRYRLYSDWGFNLKHVAKVTAFGFTTFVISLLTTSGLALAADSAFFATIFPFSATAMRLLGAILLLPIAGYMVLSIVHPGARVGYQSWGLRVPPLKISVAQLALTVVEVSCTGAILFVLLPHSALTLRMFLGLYVFSQLLGFISQIPSGLGVFDASMVVLLERFYPAGTAVGALLMFRLLFYVIPLIIALSMLFAYEVRKQIQGKKPMSPTEESSASHLQERNQGNQRIQGNQ